MNKRIFVAIVLFSITFSLVFIGGSVSETKEYCEGIEKDTIVKKDVGADLHIEYEFQFSEENHRLCVEIKNEGNRTGLSGFRAKVDGEGVAPQMPNLEPGESELVVKNLTEYLDVRQDHHIVSVGAYNKSFQYNFTEVLNASSPKVSSPYITDVEVLRDQENGSTALEVSTHNPSKLGYSFYVQAETFETKGVYRVGAPQENETSQVVLPLNESSDEVVAGKVRIFDDWANSEGKFDQKEFMARPGNETNAWDDHFERVPGTVDRYDYDNETARQYRDGYVDKDFLSPWERRAGAGLLVALVGGAVWWRRR